ncbi:MAG: hypothetical protein NVSMB33_15280 [Ktedonobacteraceae bacterium]
MPSPGPFIQIIQRNRDALQQALGSGASSFFGCFDALAIQYRDSPNTADEVYQQIQTLVASSSAATQVLQKEAPRLFKVSNSAPIAGKEPISPVADDTATSGKRAADNGGLIELESDQMRIRRDMEPAKLDAMSPPAAVRHIHTRSAASNTEGGSTPMPANRKEKETSGQKQWTPELVIQFFKEIVTALMGLALIAYTLYMLNSVLGLVGDANKLSSAKDLLLLLLGLTGVVLGYYFGRVPADARAAQAQQQAASATGKTAQVGAQANQLSQQLDNLDRAVTRGKDAITRGGGGAGGQDLTNVQEEIQRLREGLRQLSDVAHMP